jgi:hypothetical protein
VAFRADDDIRLPFATGGISAFPAPLSSLFLQRAAGTIFH